VLVYTYGDQPHEQTLSSAAKFAADNNAHLSGLFVKPDYVNYSNTYGHFLLNVAESFFEHQEKFASKAKTSFDVITKKFDCKSEWHEVDYNEPSPDPALYCDFIFIGQPDINSTVIFDETDFVDRIITSTGLPVVAIPKEWRSTEFAKSPVLGWKESKEAAGVVRHSMQLMRHADSVNIVTINRNKDLQKSLIDGLQISEYLSMHEIECEYFSEERSDDEKRESDALIRHVKEHDRDLIIIGGYSHSRFREIVLGGMTRDLIMNSPVPLLLAH